MVVGWSPAALEFVAYFDGPIAEVDAEPMSAVCAEVNADLAPELRVAYQCVRCDVPGALPLPTGWPFPASGWVYRRRES